MTDIVTELRQRHRNTTGLDPRITNPIVGPTIFLEAADEIERLRKERDEARRMLCEEWAKQDGLPLDWQGRRGAEGMAEFVKWDCFKEDTNV